MFLDARVVVVGSKFGPPPPPAAPPQKAARGDGDAASSL